MTKVSRELGGPYTRTPSRPSGSNAVARSFALKVPSNLRCGLSTTRIVGLAASA